MRLMRSTFRSPGFCPATLRCVLLAMLFAIGVNEYVVAQPIPSRVTIDAVSVRASETSRQTRVDLYARVPYVHLQFLSAAEGYAANYNVRLEVHRLDRRGRHSGLAARRNWARTVTAPTFGATRQAGGFDVSTSSVRLEPGTYAFVFEIEDLATRTPVTEQIEVEVRDLSGTVALSDLIYISDYDPHTETIYPRVTNVVGTGEQSVRLFYEVYANQPTRVRIQREIVRLSQGRSSAIRSLLTFWRSDPEDITFSTAESTLLRPGRNPRVVEVPLSGLRPGEYLVRVRVETDDGRVLAESEKLLEAEWRGLATVVRSLEEAIDQLKYIAKDRELRHIKAGRTEEERLTRFLAFWEKRDPTPGSDRNERMEEYYARVAYANRTFGGAADGWDTDRGQVVIVYGEPDQVERFPATNTARAYEVWHYSQIGKRFFFIDETGRGDFRLRVPLWDERSPIR
jgi:GWxTD domain-containing protein